MTEAQYENLMNELRAIHKLLEKIVAWYVK